MAKREDKLMKRNIQKATLFCLFLACILLQASAGQEAPGPAVPAALPGNGLAQHPFLYCGEWDYIHPQQTMHLIRDGKEVWSYSIPLDIMLGTKPDKEEFSDCTRLSNGNILFSRRFGAAIITPEKKVVWSYDAPPGTEIHSVQGVGTDHVLLMQNGNPARLLLMDTASGKQEKELVLPTAHPDKIHGQFRRVRMTRTGSYLAAHMDLNKVVEYDSAGKAIWSVDAHAAWSAVRLKNGNTLITGNQYGYVREVNSAGKTVWEITKDALRISAGYGAGSFATGKRKHSDL